MKLIVTETRYDYFDYNGRFKPVYTVFEGTDAVINAKAFYDFAKSHDYDYGDSWHKTTISIGASDDSIKVAHKIHGQRFGHKPTVREILVSNWERAAEECRRIHKKYGWCNLIADGAEYREKECWQAIENYDGRIGKPDYIEVPWADELLFDDGSNPFEDEPIII